MRVIAGSARHTTLKTIPGEDTRPTTDRIKETLFNILQFDLADAGFLDLFSGSGGIGIEALSRGAARAVFVENNRRAVACIQENLKATHLEEQAQVFGCDVLSAIAKMHGEKPFDIIFMDPPYRKGLEMETLAALAKSGLADAHTTIIIEAMKDKSFADAEELGYRITREKLYKTNKHVFLCLSEG